jgi:hypothetical protein
MMLNKRPCDYSSQSLRTFHPSAIQPRVKFSFVIVRGTRGKLLHKLTERSS